MFFTALHASFRETNVKRWLLTKRPLLTGLAEQFYEYISSFSNSFHGRSPVKHLSPCATVQQVTSFFFVPVRSMTPFTELGRFFFLFRLDVQYFYIYSDQSSHWRTERPNLDRVARTDKKPAAFLVSCLLVRSRKKPKKNIKEREKE